LEEKKRIERNEGDFKRLEGIGRKERGTEDAERNYDDEPQEED